MPMIGQPKKVDASGVVHYYSSATGTTNEQVEIAEALAECEATGRKLRMDGRRHMITSPLHWDHSKHSIECDQGFEFYAPGIAGYAVEVYQTDNWNDAVYRSGPTRWTGFRLIADGTKVTGQHGVLVGNSTIADGTTRIGANVNFVQPQIENFDTPFTIGGGGYITELWAPKFWASKRGLWLPAGANCGENIQIHGGTIFNNDLAIQNDNANGGVTLIGTSLDYNHGTFLANAGSIDMLGGNWEFASTHTGQQISVPGSTGAVRMLGGKLVVRDQGAWVKDYFLTTGHADAVALLQPTEMSAVNPLIALDNGPGQHLIKPLHIPAVSGIRGVQRNESNLLADYNFELAGAGGTPNDLIWISGDTAAITSRLTGTNLAISVSSAVAAYDGSVSLRVAKAGAAATSASFAIAVPVNRMDRIWHAFRCINPGNRSVGAGISVNMRWAKLNGDDGNGVPIIGRYSQYGTYNINPTTSWAEYKASATVTGGGAYMAPAWATHHLIVFGLTNFDGGAGASEGGNYSLYFDAFRKHAL